MSYFTAAKIGAALAKARVKAGLSQREMAILIGKNERTVQNWEKGQSSPDSDDPAGCRPSRYLWRYCTRNCTRCRMTARPTMS